MIWLIGNRGMLGTELSGVLSSRGMAHLGTDREVDIRDPEALLAYAREAAAKGDPIKWILNCSAYTNVDKAEEEEAVARTLNAQGAENIAKAAAEIGATMIHISTDYVFRGDGTVPCLESDPVDPQGAYGRTKAEGERLVAAACPKHFIVRTAWLYGKHGPNFVYSMLRLMRTKDSISVVCDQRGTPTWAFDLAGAVADIVEKDSGKYGIYHFTNEGQTEWHEFATEIQRLGRELGILEKDCAVQAITSDQYPSKVKRPAWSVLSKAKIAAELGIVPPEWKKSLRAFLEGIAQNLDELSGLAGMAEYDLESAKACQEAGRYLYVPYACHQAIEKDIKTLIQLKAKAPYTHGLRALAAKTSVPFSEAQLSLMDQLSDFYQKDRHETDVKALVEKYDEARTLKFLEGSAEICAFIRKHPIFSILQ